MVNMHSDRLSGFNRLVYEYLVKNKFEKTARVFAQEAMVGEVPLSNTPSTLLNWYNIFIETADVRSGKIYVPESLNRIEAIMMKLENDKQRYLRMSVQAALNKRPSPRLYGEPYHRPVAPPSYESQHHFSSSRSTPERSPGSGAPPGTPYERYDPREPDKVAANRPYFPQAENRAMASPPPSFVEERRVPLKLPFVLLGRFCNSSRTLLCYCADGHIYFVAVDRGEVEFEVEISRKPFRDFCTLEKDSLIYFAFSQSERSVVIGRYAKKEKDCLRTLVNIDQGTVRSFTLGGSSLFVLTDSSVLHVFTLAGEAVKNMKVSSDVIGIEYFGSNLIMIEESRVIEFDLSRNMESRIFSRGPRPAVCVRDSHMFVLYPDAIQAFGTYSPYPIQICKGGVVAKDLTMLLEKIAVCTPNEVLSFHGSIHVPHATAIAQVMFDGAPRLLVVTTQGVLLYFRLII